jgi:hypothetical protein
LNLSVQVEVIISIDEQTFEGEKDKKTMFIIGASMKIFINIGYSKLFLF